MCEETDVGGVMGCTTTGIVRLLLRCDRGGRGGAPAVKRLLGGETSGQYSTIGE